MSDRFPHLQNNESGFPYVEGVDVYKYDNGFDYSRFDASQMEIMICTVPWDMGEAHVGNRTISGIGNVVWFGTKAARDAWFASIPDDKCFRYTSKYKALHRDNEIVVDIPFDVASNYNYLYVKYNLFANDGSPVENESASGRNEWFWFIREVEFLAPNSTKLYLMNDAWQTFMYDIEIHEMMLERGHAPMFSTSVSQYLENPIQNCSYLLGEEEYKALPSIVQSTHEHVFNAGTMRALVISTANPVADWGTKADGDWRVPAQDYFTQGVNAYCAFVMAATDFPQFLINMNVQVPQFAQTMQAVCFVPDSMLTLQDYFEFCGITCNLVTADYVTSTVHDISAGDFNYPARYAGISKLYTYPYAYIVLTDQEGNETEVHVEDTDGTITLKSMVNLVFPWLNINGQITSVGKGTRRNVTFANVTERNMPIGGNWHELLMTWKIPTFGIVQQPSTYNDFNTHFDRVQARIAADNANANVNSSADALIADAAANGQCLVDNTTHANNAAYQTMLYHNDMLDAVNTASNYKIDQDASIASSVNYQTTAINNEFASIANGISSSGSVASAAVDIMAGIGSSASSSGLGGVFSGMASANHTLISQATASATLVNSIATDGQLAVLADLANRAYALEARTNNNSNLSASRNYNANASQQARDCATSQAQTSQSNMNAVAGNDAGTMRLNAGRNWNTSTNAIANQVSQAALMAPQTFGDLAAGLYATSRPLGLFSNVVTLNDFALKQAGDEFSRYGYSLNAFWEFDGDWNVGKHFTYWKLSDFWISGLNVPDMYVDKIRFFLFGGVTVWRVPEEIGNVSIYDNFPDDE